MCATLALLLTIAALPANAQSQPSSFAITGTALDPRGAPLQQRRCSGT